MVTMTGDLCCKCLSLLKAQMTISIFKLRYIMLIPLLIDYSIVYM